MRLLLVFNVIISVLVLSHLALALTTFQCCRPFEGYKYFRSTFSGNLSVSESQTTRTYNQRINNNNNNNNNKSTKPYTSRHNARRDLSRVFEARNIEFGFPSEGERQRALQSGQYNFSSPVPIDIDVHYTGTRGRRRIFWTIPRFGSGVPYSLAYVTNSQRPFGPELQPYPSYEWHRSHGADCLELTSVFRIYIDPCGQLWAMDSGEIELIHLCPPSIAVFDLSTDRLVHRHYFPSSMYKANVSRFTSIEVDFVESAERGKCKEAYVYAADPVGTGFVVSHVVIGSGLTTLTWRVENKYTYPDPAFGTHTIAGESFELVDGVFTFSITPANLGLRRHLYFHSLTGDQQMAIPLDVVRNPNRWVDGILSALDEFKPLGNRGIQCSVEVMTPNGLILCPYFKPIGIFAWNIRTPYTPENRFLIYENPITLQFVSGFKIIKNPRTRRDEIWIASNRLQKAFTNTLNYSEINFRIQCCALDDFIAGRNCDCDENL